MNNRARNLPALRSVIIFIVVNLLLLATLSPLVIFYGPFQSLKIFTVNTIATSRHPQVAEFFLDPEEIRQLMHESRNSNVTVEPVINDKKDIVVDEKNGIRVETIKGKYFSGRVMLVSDPLQVRVAVTEELGIAGQRLSQLVQNNNAIAGINGGGFYDPNAQGNGAFPEGITVSNGVVAHNSMGQLTGNIIGFDAEGSLILGEMNGEQVLQAGIQQAVTFNPNLLINGAPQIQGDGGWGIAPRTGIGQRQDGTVIMVVIDGRQPGYSMGATLRDLMNVFIEYQAVNAANLDGGSSTELYYNGEIINSLWNIYGERYMPTAFVVMPKQSK